MTNFSRVYRALSEYEEYIDTISIVSKESFVVWLEQNYGVRYKLESNHDIDECLTVINPELYTFFLLKWP